MNVDDSIKHYIADPLSQGIACQGLKHGVFFHVRLGLRGERHSLRSSALGGVRVTPAVA